MDIITTYLSETQCRCCGNRMEAINRPETVQTNSAGVSRILPALTVISCKTPGCTLEMQTFPEHTYASEDLTVYGVEAVS